MPESPLQAAGAQIEPSAAAPLHTNEWFTGMLTNGNPLGPGAVPYLYQKFYSANRYDRLVGGLNTEITARATLGRRLGHTVVNNSLPSAAERMYLFQAFNTAGQNNRLLADIGTEVADVTGTGTVQVFTKASGAGRACFQGVGNTCYMGDGVDLEKFMQAGKQWQANTVFNQGDIVSLGSGGPNDVFYVVESFATLTVIGVAIIVVSGTYYAVVTFQYQPLWAPGTNVTFSGVQTYSALNGVRAVIDPSTLPTIEINGNQAIFAISSAAAIYGPVTDYGIATSQPSATTGESGSTTSGLPSSVGFFGLNGNIYFQNFGHPMYSWSPAPPTVPPSLYVGGAPNNSAIRFWRGSYAIFNSGGSPLPYSILDANNNLQLTVVPASSATFTGPTVPRWSQQVPSATAGPGVTLDLVTTWLNCGPIVAWLPSFVFYGYQCILDSNGNLQYVSAGGGGSSSSSPPSWNTATGGTTTDGALTWTNCGPGIILLNATRQYFFAYHTISGQVSSLSPAAVLNPNGSILGAEGSWLATITGPTLANQDIDQIWIFATAQGGSVPLLLARIPNPDVSFVSAFSFTDNFPDTFLNAEIVGPQNHLNDPPPPTFVPAAFHLGLICGFVGNVIFYSNGTTAVGNPNESFPPLNNFQLPSAPVAAWSTALGLIIMRVDGFSVMLGSNTAANPLYIVNIFDGVGLAARDAFTTRGNSLSMVTTTGKVMRFTTAQFISSIQGGTSQALPDDEIGFPIGDLLAQFTPANCYVAWYEGPSNDSGLFICDGSSSWYMMRVMTMPDQATPWSPIATISTGISAIYACETSPGINSLLVATPAGPIWKRDQSTNADAGMSFAANTDISPIVLSQPGNTVTVQFVTTEEKKISGATPLTVGVLFDEISGTFIPLAKTTNDPPNLRRSKTIETQRFQANQGAGTIPICRYLLQQISWGTQNFPNELLTNTIYGRLPSRAHR